MSSPDRQWSKTSTGGSKHPFQVEAANPSVVVVAQSYYHPWIAKVDGVITPVRRANHAFTALKIPSGNHEVHLLYMDHSFRRGPLISVTALLVAGGLLLVSIRNVRLAPVV